MTTLKPAQPAHMAPSRRRMTLPPEFRRMYWRTSLMCLSAGAAWGYIALRIEEFLAWHYRHVFVLESWERAWPQGAIAVAVGVGVVLGLELAHRIARYLACRAVPWLRRRRHNTGVPFPGRNAALTALYAGPATVLVVALVGPLLLGVQYQGAMYLLLIAAGIVIAPFEACHLTVRWVAWDRRCRAAVRGAPWRDGPVRLFEPSARDRARDALYPPRFALLTLASPLVPVAPAMFGALAVLTDVRWPYIRQDMYADASLLFVGHYLGTFAACEVLHRVIRFFVWLYRFQHPDAATPRP